MCSPVEQVEPTEAPATLDWNGTLQAHRVWLERLVAARTGGVEHVEEVMQELHLAVAQSASRPVTAEEAGPWLCTIAVRLCARIVRDRVRRQRKLEGFRLAQQTQPAPVGDPIFWLLHAEQEAIVRGELAALDAEMRQMLLWKDVHGLTYAEIAARLAVSRHVAEYRVLAARRELRRRLHARGIGQEDS